MTTTMEREQLNPLQYIFRCREFRFSTFTGRGAGLFVIGDHKCNYTHAYDKNFRRFVRFPNYGYAI